MNGLPMTPCAVTDRLVQMLRDSDSRGAAEYGATVDRTDLSPLDWIDHATAENLDSAKYLQALRRPLENGAAQPAASQEAVAWAVYGKSDEWPEPVLLADYVGSMEVIRKRVMEGAIREGFKGDFVERMAELGWWLEPLALAAPVTAAPARPSALTASIARLDEFLEGDCVEPLTLAQSEAAALVLQELKRRMASTPAAPGIDLEPAGWQYRVTAGPQTGWSPWMDGRGEKFEKDYTVERRRVYAQIDASPKGDDVVGG